MDRRREGWSGPNAVERLDVLDGGEAPLDWRERLRATWRRPLGRALAGVAAIGLLALLYLNQVAGVAVANTQLSALDAEHNHLQRQDSQLHEQLGTYTSPAYIDRRARAMGLAPAPFGAALFIASGHGPMPQTGQGNAGGQP